MTTTPGDDAQPDHLQPTDARPADAASAPHSDDAHRAWAEPTDEHSGEVRSHAAPGGSEPDPTSGEDGRRVVEKNHRDPALAAELASIRALGENRVGGE